MGTKEDSLTPADFLEQNPWLASPAAFALHFSKGRWETAAHLMLLSQKLIGVVTGAIPRLVVSMPPRHGKSMLVSKWLPAWYLSLMPESTVIFTAYGAEFAEEWGARTRDVLTEHGPALGIKVRQDSAARWAWSLTAGGGMVATGVGGPLLGRGANLFIMDDPIKEATEAFSQDARNKLWDWWTTTARTRLEPGAGCVLVMSRWHHDDIAGRLLTQSDEKWELLRLPAIAEGDDSLGRTEGEALWPYQDDGRVRFNRASLEAIKGAVGSRVWNAMYQQRPTPEEGGLLTGWRFYNPTLADDKEFVATFDQVIQSWDMSFTDSEGSDYVVCEVWGRKRGEFYLLDLLRERLNFPATVSKLKMMSMRWPQTRVKLIEESANGYAILQALRHEIPGMVATSTHGKSKVIRVSQPLERLHAVSALVEAGRCLIPDPAIRRWAQDFIQECNEFPHGAHDDQVDSMSQALIYLQPGSWREAEAPEVVLSPLEAHNKVFWDRMRTHYWARPEKKQPERYQYMHEPRSPNRGGA
jgi:predicted phage terminase large subunit-like protein